MPRGFQIHGESLVTVRMLTPSSIGKTPTTQELGLATDSIVVKYDYSFKDLKVNAWGFVPPDTQNMGFVALITMSLIHWDEAVLTQCINNSLGGAPSYGTRSFAGATLGGGEAQFGGESLFSNFLISLGVNNRGLYGRGIPAPYRFLYTHLINPPTEIPIGTKTSVINLNWRAIPYTPDPYYYRQIGGIEIVGGYNADVFDRVSQ